MFLSMMMNAQPHDIQPMLHGISKMMMRFDPAAAIAGDI
jgi:hypothetical protein